MSGLNAGGSYRPLIVEMALSTPNFLTCSLWAVNTVIAEDRLLLWRSRTRPTRATSGMGASTHRVDPRRDRSNGPTPDLRHGAGTKRSLPVFGHLRDRERTMRFPQRAHITRREDRAVLETLRVAGQATGFDADHDCLIKGAASGPDGVPSRFGAIGDMRTNAQPAARNERITWITSPSCCTAMGRPQRRKTFSIGRLRESTAASSRSRPFTRAMAMICRISRLPNPRLWKSSSTVKASSALRPAAA